MKTREKIFFGLAILILMCIHWYLFRTKEGFFDDATFYNGLRGRLQNDLGPYCQISAFIRDQVSEMQQGLQAVSSSLPSVDEIKEAASSPAALKTQSMLTDLKIGPLTESWYDFSSDLTFSAIYKSVYMCTDTLAKARRSCSSPNLNMNYVPCSVYLELPEWSTQREVVAALRRITKDLPERLNREADWFQAVIDKIQTGLDAGARPQAGDNPPGVVPSVAQMEKFKKEAEGFTSEGFVCSQDAMDFLRQKASEAEAKSCTPVTTSSEIARVNALLDQPSTRASIERMRNMYGVMLKLKGDLEKLKNGTLYDWQKDGPTKKYPFCGGGDRLKSLMCSIKQNMM